MKRSFLHGLNLQTPNQFRALQCIEQNNFSFVRFFTSTSGLLGLHCYSLFIYYKYIQRARLATLGAVCLTKYSAQKVAPEQIAIIQQKHHFCRKFYTHCSNCKSTQEECHISFEKKHTTSILLIFKLHH